MNCLFIYMETKQFSLYSTGKILTGFSESSYDDKNICPQCLWNSKDNVCAKDITSFIKFPHPHWLHYHDKCIVMYCISISLLSLSLSLSLSLFAIHIPPSFSFEPPFTPVTGQTSSVPGFFHLWMTTRLAQTLFPCPTQLPITASDGKLVMESWAGLGGKVSLHFYKEFSFK